MSGIRSQIDSPLLTSKAHHTHSRWCIPLIFARSYWDRDAAQSISSRSLQLPQRQYGLAAGFTQLKKVAHVSVRHIFRIAAIYFWRLMQDSYVQTDECGVRFAELLSLVAAIDPEMRIRFQAPHPKVVRRRSRILLKVAPSMWSFTGANFIPMLFRIFPTRFCRSSHALRIFARASTCRPSTVRHRCLRGWSVDTGTKILICYTHRIENTKLTPYPRAAISREAYTNLVCRAREILAAGTPAGTG